MFSERHSGPFRRFKTDFGKVAGRWYELGRDNTAHDASPVVAISRPYRKLRDCNRWPLRRKRCFPRRIPMAHSADSSCGSKISCRRVCRFHLSELARLERPRKNGPTQPCQFRTVWNSGWTPRERQAPRQFRPRASSINGRTLPAKTAHFNRPMQMPNLLCSRLAMPQSSVSMASTTNSVPLVWARSSIRSRS